MTRARILALFLLVVGLLAGYFVIPTWGPAWIDVPFRLGLDLQGGTHLVYRVDTSQVAAGDKNAALESLRDVIERRVNFFGVAEPVVQLEKSVDENRLIVEIAGVFDIREAIKLIGETPFLQFYEEKPPKQVELKGDINVEGDTPVVTIPPAPEVPEEEFPFQATDLTGQYLKRADLQFDPTTNQPIVTLEFNDEGAAIFEALTKKSVGKRIAIFLDGVPLSAPVVNEPISGGRAQISGNFTPEEARSLARRLTAGALPVPITLLSQQSIGAALGNEELEKSLHAAFIGFGAVALFMIGWYRLPGLFAVGALGIYAAIVLSLFKLIPVTLTTAGIAGFILSIGMAVDANILIFERMKEELRAGKSFFGALEDGFGRAWTSIRDSNVSSLITSAILWWFGTSAVKGFALTLSIGILVSMFSAIVVTRTFLRALTIRNEKLVRILYGVKIS
jgi:protein-export membrane protein SecD